MGAIGVTSFMENWVDVSSASFLNARDHVLCMVSFLPMMRSKGCVQ
jgi:hypothetical protein